MNRLIFELIMGAILLALAGGLYFVIGENGKLEKENEDLADTIVSHELAVENMAIIITDLSIKYNKVSHDEFEKFKKSDLSKVPMGKLVQSFNIGSSKLLKDYKKRTTEFIGGYPKTTSP